MIIFRYEKVIHIAMSVQSKEFDYVIAGAGSAGCALAARLCEDPSVSVCLVEAGGKGRDWYIRMPAGNGFVFGNPKLDWGYESVPQMALKDRRIYFPARQGSGWIIDHERHDLHARRPGGL